MELANKVAFITGGTRGIGRAIAETLIQAGASVFVTGRDAQDVTQTVRELNKAVEASNRAAGTACDVRDANAVTQAFTACAAELGGVDILVNNAGIGIFGSLADLTPEDFRAVIETNLCGVFYCCHAALPLMKERGGGYIINISSLAGANAHPRMTAYNASKFGLNGFSEALMQEVRHDNIKVSYIMPGSVNTEFAGGTPSAAQSWKLQPVDVAQVVLDLLNQPARSLPSRVELRPSRPPQKK